jgi:hypothetical protein
MRANEQSKIRRRREHEQGPQRWRSRRPALDEENLRKRSSKHRSEQRQPRQGAGQASSTSRRSAGGNVNRCPAHVIREAQRLLAEGVSVGAAGVAIFKLFRDQL